MSLVIDLAVALFMVWITWWWLHDELVFMSFLLGEKGFHASFLFTTVAFTFLFFVVGAIALLRQAFICGQPGKREHRSLQIIFLTIKASILSNRGRLLFELIGYIYKDEKCGRCPTLVSTFSTFRQQWQWDNYGRIKCSNHRNKLQVYKKMISIFRSVNSLTHQL